MGLRSWHALGVLAFTSAAIVAAEVLLTRLLSAITWYGLAFFVLSLAMVGLTAGALDADRARRAGQDVASFVASRLTRFSVGLLLPVAFACLFSFDSEQATQALKLIILAAASTVPLASGGAVIARLLAEATVPLNVLYGVDLLAAALGALSPLVLLGPLSAPAAVVLLALVAAALATTLPGTGPRWPALALGVGLAAVLGLGLAGVIDLEPRYLKHHTRPPIAKLRHHEWNSMSHVMLKPFEQGKFELWSPSPLAGAQILGAEGVIDGEAGTPVYAFKQLEDVAELRRDAVFSAHALRPDGLACVIGVGGGRDLLAARLFGHDRVIGVEINPAIVKMLRSVRDISPVLDDPRISVEVSDGRAYFARSQERCRVLQASLVDTWAATSAGAFAHAEATLYTREAWSIFLRRTEPDGVLTFSRWFNPASLDETGRLVALAVAALLDRGITDVRQHIALVASGRVATILVSPSPFTARDRERLLQHVALHRFKAVIVPGEEPGHRTLARLLSTRSVADLAEAGAARGHDTSAPTDDRPFFFQFLSARLWLQPQLLFGQYAQAGGVIGGNVKAANDLVTTFLAVLLTGALVLGRPLRRALEGGEKGMPGRRSFVYFGALGAGFMLVEVAAVQRMHVVLGHPTWALIAVLASLLVAMGVGSTLSTRILSTRRQVSLAAALAAVLLVVIPHAVIGPLARATVDASLAVRVVWVALVSAFMGGLLGMFFPAGLRHLDRAGGAPIALAINGLTGVLGGVIAILVSVWVSIPASFALAGAIYLLAALCGPHAWPTVESKPH